MKSLLKFNHTLEKNKYKKTMIREVHSEDTRAVASIYNECLRHSVITFETEL